MASATPDNMVTFPATEHHHSLTGTKLYCLVTEAHGCWQLAQSCCLAVHRLGVEPVTSRSRVRHANHYTTKPPLKLLTALKYICTYKKKQTFCQIIIFRNACNIYHLQKHDNAHYASCIFSASYIHHLHAIITHQFTTRLR